MVDSNFIPWSDQERFRQHFTPERIVQAVKAYQFTADDNIRPEDVASLSPKDVIVDLSPMHYGMKDKNPLDFVKFYSKRNPNRECRLRAGALWDADVSHQNRR